MGAHEHPSDVTPDEEAAQYDDSGANDIKPQVGGDGGYNATDDAWVTPTGPECDAAIVEAAIEVVRLSGNRSCREGEPPMPHVNPQAFARLASAVGQRQAARGPKAATS